MVLINLGLLGECPAKAVLDAEFGCGGFVTLGSTGNRSNYYW